MGKMIHQITLLSFIVLLFYAAGFPQMGGISTLLTMILNPSAMASTNLFIKLGAAFIGIGIGITVSFFFSGQNLPIILKVGIATLLFEFIFDLIVIWNILRTINDFFAIAIISPLLIIFGFTVFEWVTGRD